MKEKQAAKEKKRYGSIMVQVATLFVAGVLTTGILTYFVQRSFSNATVKREMERFAGEIAEEVKKAVEQYPAHGWLLRYWYENGGEMEIEYDAEYGAGTVTEEKCRTLAERQPDLQIAYADEERIEKLPEEDKKLYAEIVYSWVITRIDQIKRSFKVDFLFCVVTEEPYDSQFFLLSAADPGAVRGTDYEQVYTLGVVSSVGESQQEAMRHAAVDSGYFGDAGNYVDYYAYLGEAGKRVVLTGLTYNAAEIKKNVDNQTAGETMLAVMNQMILSMICMVLIAHYVLNPLREVQQNIALFTEKKNSAEVVANLSEIRPYNEIGELSEDVSGLAEEIDDYTKRIRVITAEKERAATEMDLASRIQSNMLPTVFPAFPDRDEFDLYASMDPAKAVGGDFYDYFMTDDDHLAMLIADVSGKGVPAALFMMISMILLHNLTEEQTSPAAVLEAVNEKICARNPEQMFVSVWLGILEISTGTLTAANAGHEYPALKHKGQRYDLIKNKHGFVIGGMSGLKYKDYTIKIDPGSKLFLYTDGLPEASDKDGQMFGTGRMLDVLNSNLRYGPEKTILAMKEAVDAFVGDAEQFDDLTMLCVSYHGPKKEKDGDGTENGPGETA